MKAQLKNGGVEILLEEDETARAILAAVAMAAFALDNGHDDPRLRHGLPVSEALTLPKVMDSAAGTGYWQLDPCTLYGRSIFVTGRQTGEHEVTATFPRPLSDSMFAAFGTHLARAIERVVHQ